MDNGQAIAEWIKDQTLEEWDKYVVCQPTGCIYFSSHWKRILERSFKHIKFHVAVVRDPKSRKIRSGIPVCSVRSWLLGNRLVCVPFAPVSYPLIHSPSDFHKLLTLITQLGHELAVRRIEIRTSSKEEFIQSAGLSLQFYPSTGYIHHYIPLHTTLNEIWSNTDRKSIRTMVLKAKKLGLSVLQNNSEHSLRSTFELIYDSRRRLGLPPIPWQFFATLREELIPSGNYFCFLVLKDKEPISGLICLRSGDSFSLEYCGDKEDQRVSGSPQLCYWTAIETAKELGCAQVSFGRSASCNKSLIRYKEHWGCLSESLAILVHSPNKKGYLEQREETFSYKLIRFLAKKSPNRFYQKLGNFCYRHMG